MLGGRRESELGSDLSLGLGYGGEVLVYLQTLGAATLGMILAGENVVEPECRTKLDLSIPRHTQARSVVLGLDVVGVDEILVRAVLETGEWGVVPRVVRSGGVDAVPADLRDFKRTSVFIAGIFKANDRAFKQAEPFVAAKLKALVEHQLQAEADAN